ncbi:hypothetical protein Tcan_13712 [Toxocara canis]|uniref:Uncharacterized protein n=1 Tax=Toxocara canis TaxID=6265 RepID=A0A0B2V620_TOXCA|nr:hypothetical protein Tcan_13712 [Toxocara canis]
MAQCSHFLLRRFINIAIHRCTEQPKNGRLAYHPNEIEQLQRLYDELTESWREDEDAAGSLVDANVDRRYVPYKRRLQFQAARGKKSLTTNKRFQYMPSRGKRSTL